MILAREADFDFSSDLIGFQSVRDGQEDLYLMAPDGAKVINITQNPAADNDAAWSDDEYPAW